MRLVALADQGCHGLCCCSRLVQSWLGDFATGVRTHGLSVLRRSARFLTAKRRAFAARLGFTISLPGPSLFWLPFVFAPVALYTRSISRATIPGEAEVDVR